MAGQHPHRKREDFVTHSIKSPRKLIEVALQLDAINAAARAVIFSQLVNDPAGLREAQNGYQPDTRHIEVKGRAKGATTVTITRNEMIYARNHANKFLLAIALVDEDDKVEGPWYIRNPFECEPGWGIASINYELKALLAHVESE